VPYAPIIFSSLLFFCGGLYLAWSSWLKIRPASGGGSAAGRMAAMRGQSVSASAPAGGASSGGRASGFGKR
jgi:hypothetical protein